MYPPIILAHGALGIWDEVIFIGVAAVFLAMMGISWVRSRMAAPPDKTDTVPTPDSPPDAESDHFRLE